MKRLFILSLSFFVCAATFISCSKELSFESDNSVATGSLHDTSGNCYTASVHGTYKSGVAVGDSNYVVVQVNVTSGGNYTIATDTVNGFGFASTGYFNAKGVQSVTLKASGKPVSGQATNFTLVFDTTVCSFTVNINSTQNPTVNDSDSAWAFSEGGRRYTGYIDTAYTYDTVAFGQKFRLMQLQGATAATGDSVFLLSVAFPGGSIATGTYPTTTSTFFRFLGSYNINDSLYSASPFTPGVITSVSISAYNANTQVIQGTFNGTAKNKSGTTVNITAGKLTAKLN